MATPIEPSGGWELTLLEIGRARHPGEWVGPGFPEWMWTPMNGLLLRRPGPDDPGRHRLGRAQPPVAVRGDRLRRTGRRSPRRASGPARSTPSSSPTSTTTTSAACSQGAGPTGSSSPSRGRGSSRRGPACWRSTPARGSRSGSRSDGGWSRSCAHSGRLHEVEPGDEIADGVRLSDAPGHRAGHCCVEVGRRPPADPHRRHAPPRRPRRAPRVGRPRRRRSRRLRSRPAGRSSPSSPRRAPGRSPPTWPGRGRSPSSTAAGGASRPGRTSVTRDELPDDTRRGAAARYTDRGQGERTIVLVHGWKGSHRHVGPRRLPADARVPGDRLRQPRHGRVGQAGRAATTSRCSPTTSPSCSRSARRRARSRWSAGRWAARSRSSTSPAAASRAARLVLMNGPLKLTRTPEFPWTMSEEQLRGYLDDLAAELARGGAELQPRRPPRPELGLRRALTTRSPCRRRSRWRCRIVDEQAKLEPHPVLPALQLPVLALYGRHDPYYPAALAEYIAEHAPDGSYVIFEESAHAPHYEETERFCEVVGEFARRRAMSGEALPRRERRGRRAGGGGVRLPRRRAEAERVGARELEARADRRGALPRRLALRRRRGVRPDQRATRTQLLIDYEVGPTLERMLRVNTARVVPGPLLGRPEGTLRRDADEVADAVTERRRVAPRLRHLRHRDPHDQGPPRARVSDPEAAAAALWENRRGSHGEQGGVRCRFASGRTPSSSARPVVITPS